MSGNVAATVDHLECLERDLNGQLEIVRVAREKLQQFLVDKNKESIT